MVLRNELGNETLLISWRKSALGLLDTHNGSPFYGGKWMSCNHIKYASVPTLFGNYTVKRWGNPDSKFCPTTYLAWDPIFYWTMERGNSCELHPNIYHALRPTDWGRRGLPDWLVNIPCHSRDWFQHFWLEVPEEWTISTPATRQNYHTLDIHYFYFSKMYWNSIQIAQSRGQHTIKMKNYLQELFIKKTTIVILLQTSKWKGKLKHFYTEVSLQLIIQSGGRKLVLLKTSLVHEPSVIL